MFSYTENPTKSTSFAWRILWAVDPGRLESMESQRVGHDRVSTHKNECLITIFLKGNP